LINDGVIALIGA